MYNIDDVNSCNIDTLPESTLSSIEADSFWCFSKLLDGIHDHYTTSQAGIQVMVNKLQELIHRIDGTINIFLYCFNTSPILYPVFVWYSSIAQSYNKGRS